MKPLRYAALYMDEVSKMEARYDGELLDADFDQAHVWAWKRMVRCNLMPTLADHGDVRKRRARFEGDRDGVRDAQPAV